MALINCSECGKEISNKAQTCPHCGAPVVDDSWAIDIIPVAKSFIVICILFAIIIFTYPLFETLFLGIDKEPKQKNLPISTVQQNIFNPKEESKLILPQEQSAFETIGYYKKHSFRVFSVYTSSVDAIRLKEYAKNKMYILGGMTMVFFF